MDWRQIGFDAYRFPDNPAMCPDEREQRHRAMLSRVLHSGHTVAVVGSGLSLSLGYPKWQSFARQVVQATIDHLLREDSRPFSEASTEIRRLRSFQKFLQQDPDEADANSLMFYIGVCKKLLDTCDTPSSSSPYYETLCRIFHHKAEGREEPSRVHSQLLELPIRRFVTTNYDAVLELALESKRNFGRKVEDAELFRRSFTSNHLEPLARFALAAGDDAPRVYHCHGRYDEPESIIATEDDYQRWYLSEDEHAVAFQQTFELLSRSNPLLFLGYGLQDEDLLHFLRQLVALDSRLGTIRPLFALLPRDESDETKKARDDDRFELFHDRYGLHVIPFRKPPAGESWDDAYVQAFEKIAEDLRCAHGHWVEKPALRHARVRLRAPRAYRYFAVKEPAATEVLAGPGPRARLQRELRGLVENPDVQVVLLLGPSGSGKTWHALRLLEELEAGSSTFDGVFYWNAHYSNEMLTALDRALEYVDLDRKLSGSRLERLGEALREKKYLLFLDGFERSLEPCGRPGCGKTYLTALRTFLSLIREPGESTVVLGSRLWPVELEHSGELENVRCLRLSPLQAEEVTRLPPFTDPRDASAVAELCSLLDGRPYALALAGRCVRSRDVGTPLEDRLADLNGLLAAVAPHLRLDRMIELVIADVDRRTSGVARGLLEYLSMFTIPIAWPTLQTCYQAVAREEIERPGFLEELHALLLHARLLFPLDIGSPEKPARHDTCYVVHLAVRRYLLQGHESRSVQLLPSLGLCGPLTDRPVVWPVSRRTQEIMKDLFDRLCDEVKSGLEDPAQTAECGRLIRRAFSLIRARVDALGAPAWTTYDEYVQLATRLKHLCLRASEKRTWRFRSQDHLRSVEDPEGVLYAADLAWLYNDLGLALCQAGRMDDALLVWEQGHEIHRMVEGHGEAKIGDYVIQSFLNLTHAYVDQGRLPDAKLHLDQAEQAVAGLDSLDFTGQILTYRHWLAYLRGDLPATEGLFEAADARLREAGNESARSFLYMIHASYARHQGDERSARLLDESRAFARNRHRADLLAWIRLSDGRQRVLDRKWRAAHRIYYEVLATARRHGNLKLEAQVREACADLARRQGDFEGSRRLAVHALSLANELGLGLFQTRALQALGRATLDLGQQRLAQAYLEHARERARSQQFWLCGRELEDTLREIETAGGS